MITESAQMLSTAVNLKVSNGLQTKGLFKTSFVNHPCSVWTRESKDNFDWLIDHAVQMAIIYHRVYKKEHKSLNTVLNCKKYSNMFPRKGLTNFADCTEFKDLDADIFTKYQRFMILKWTERDPSKKLKPTWHNRDVPYFLLKG